MEYIQLDENGQYLRDLPNGIPIHWNAIHYCSVAALVADGHAEFFKVVPVLVTEPPLYDVRTETCERSGAELIGDTWRHSWKISKKSEVEIADYDNQLQQQLRSKAKQERQKAVDAIKVTTSTGKVFDGDEVSQTRMTRAIVALQSTQTTAVTWVLADNTSTQATLAELTEALALAGAAQANIWVI